MYFLIALLQQQAIPVEQTGNTVAALPASTLGVYLAIGLAGVAAFQLLATAGMTSWAQSRKDKRDAERKEKEVKLAAELKSKERQEDWDRQDAVADRVAKAAAQAADAAALLVESNKDVAGRVATAATQAADAAQLLLDAQAATAHRADTAAEKVALVAQQATDAAQLLLVAQKETITRTDEVARIAAENDKRVNVQLIAIDTQGKKTGDMSEKIHKLVNSDMTAARIAERSALKLLVIAIRKTNKLTADEQQEIIRVEKRISELDKILIDRAEAQRLVDAEIATKSDGAVAIEALKTRLDENTKATDKNTAVTAAVAKKE